MLILCTLLFASQSDIVFVGNSYTQSNQLHQMVELLLEEGAWSNVETTALTGGGLKFTDHLQRSVQNSNWNQSLNEPSDWVFFQEQSQIPGFPATEQAWLDSRNAFVQLDDLVEAQGGSTFLLMTWGRRDGDSMNTWLYPDFETMQDLLMDGYLAYAMEAAQPNRPIYMANAGSAFAYMKTHHSEYFEGLYSGDGSHPSYNGSYLAACVIYSSITGRSTMAMTSGAPAMAEIYQSVADSVVIDQPFGDFVYPWAWSELPLDGMVTAVGLRPLLKYNEDSALDIHLEDGRMWVEGGTIQGDLYIDGQSEVHLYEGTIGGDIWGDLMMSGGTIRSRNIEGNLFQQQGEIVVSSETIVTGMAQLDSATISLEDGIDFGRLTAGVLEVSSLVVGEEYILNVYSEEGYLEMIRVQPEESEEPASEPEEPTSEPTMEPTMEPTTEPEEPTSEPEEPTSEPTLEKGMESEENQKTGCQTLSKTESISMFFASLLLIAFRRRRQLETRSKPKA